MTMKLNCKIIKTIVDNFYLYIINYNGQDSVQFDKFDVML